MTDRELIERLRDDLQKMVDLADRTRELQGREHVSLGVECRNAIAAATARLAEQPQGAQVGDLPKLKRYGFDHYVRGMIPASNGEWVKFDDVCAAIAALRQPIQYDDMLLAALTGLSHTDGAQAKFAKDLTRRLLAREAAKEKEARGNGE